MASIPLFNEVSQLLAERYGGQAHGDLGVNLRREEIASLVTVAEPTATVLLAIRASRPGQVQLAMDSLLAWPPGRGWWRWPAALRPPRLTCCAR